ncbi:hypothetical protein F4805DRAFT_263076 [Annulohypoxylon moriforme]|nr:hypothetical protein F4805DRAFT_263076 [Annulohypoxylon moriforme]
MAPETENSPSSSGLAPLIATMAIEGQPSAVSFGFPLLERFDDYSRWAADLEAAAEEANLDHLLAPSVPEPWEKDTIESFSARLAAWAQEDENLLRVIMRTCSPFFQRVVAQCEEPTAAQAVDTIKAVCRAFGGPPVKDHFGLPARKSESPCTNLRDAHQAGLVPLPAFQDTFATWLPKLRGPSRGPWVLAKPPQNGDTFQAWAERQERPLDGRFVLASPPCAADTFESWRRRSYRWWRQRAAGADLSGADAQTLLPAGDPHSKKRRLDRDWDANRPDGI